MDAAAFTTAATPAPTSPSAAIRSMSRWLITAMSPGSNRLMRSLVRRSILAVPTTAVAGRVLRRATGPRLLEGVARLEQLGRMAARMGRLPHSGQHAGELAHPLLAGHCLRARHRALPLLALLDHDLRIGEGRHLREVRDDQYLVPPGEVRQQAAHRDARLATDAGVDFVEHQRGRGLRE